VVWKYNAQILSVQILSVQILTVQILSVQILTVQILSVQILSVQILSVQILTGNRLGLDHDCFGIGLGEITVLVLSLHGIIIWSKMQFLHQLSFSF